MADFEQIKDFNCPICFSIYSERNNIPYTLLCGHTHCHICLSNLIYNGNSCGKCRKPIPFNYKLSLPVNYALLGAIESYSNVASKEEIFEFKEIENKVEATLEKLSERKAECNSGINSYKRELEEIDSQTHQLINAKNNLKKIKRSLVSNSLVKSMERIKQAVSNIENLDNHNQYISDKLLKDEQIREFGAFLQSPQDYFISSDRTNQVSTSFVKSNTIYVNSFPQHLSSRRDYEIKVGILKPYIKRVFVKFGFGRCSSTVEIKFFDLNGTRSKHLIESCLGEQKSLREAEIYGHDSVGFEGESFSIGNDGDKETASDINFGSQKMDYIRSGYICASENERRVNHFKIYLQDKPSRNCFNCFGKITQGISSLQSATKNKLQLKILECGVIIERDV